MSDTTDGLEQRPCPHGDPTCPCQDVIDGQRDPCHYEPTATTHAMRCYHLVTAHPELLPQPAPSDVRVRALIDAGNALDLWVGDVGAPARTAWRAAVNALDVS